MIGDCDKGEIRFFRGGHHFGNRSAAVGRSGMNVDHAYAFVGALTARKDRKLDKQTFQQDSRRNQEDS